MRRNELILSPPHADAAETTGEGEIWDLPPTDSRDANGALRRQSEHGAAVADRQAAQGRAEGDETYAVTREEDAADLRQGRWGRGDARTWAWIALMCVGFLLLTALMYFLPYGRHAAPPPIRVY